MSLSKRLAALGVSAVVALGGVTAAALPASAASAASTAFSKCMDGYLNGQQLALKAGKDKIATAILYTGYANCYYDLSQRSDISDQQEIDAINNYNSYLAKAQIAIGKAGAEAYKQILRKYGLKGLTL